MPPPPTLSPVTNEPVGPEYIHSSSAFFRGQSFLLGSILHSKSCRRVDKDTQTDPPPPSPASFLPPSPSFPCFSRHLWSPPSSPRSQPLWSLQVPFIPTLVPPRRFLGIRRARRGVLRRSTSPARRWIGRRSPRTTQRMGVQHAQIRSHLGSSREGRTVSGLLSPCLVGRAKEREGRRGKRREGARE